MSGDTDSMGEHESVPAGFALVQLDDLELGYGSQRLSEELGLTASGIWITRVAPGEVIALDQPEHEPSVLLGYRGEIDIEWDDFSATRLRSGDLALVHPPRRGRSTTPAGKTRVPHLLRRREPGGAATLSTGI